MSFLLQVLSSFILFCKLLQSEFVLRAWFSSLTLVIYGCYGFISFYQKTNSLEQRAFKRAIDLLKANLLYKYVCLFSCARNITKRNIVLNSIKKIYCSPLVRSDGV